MDKCNMYKDIIKACENFQTAIDNMHKNLDITKEEDRSISYFDIILAEAIINDAGCDHAKRIAKIILSYFGE